VNKALKLSPIEILPKAGLKLIAELADTPSYEISQEFSKFFNSSKE